MKFKQRNNDYKRNGSEDVAYTFKNYIDCAAVITFYGTVECADRKVDNGDKNREQERQSRTCRKTGENILTVCVCAEQERRFVTVFVDIIFAVKNADFITCLVFNGVCEPFAVFAGICG